VRTSKAVTVTVPPTLLEEAEQVAREEGRTTSALFREAVGRYLRKRRWRELCRYGSARARRLGITEQDVERLIHEYRRERRAREEKPR